MMAQNMNGQQLNPQKINGQPGAPPQGAPQIPGQGPPPALAIHPRFSDLTAKEQQQVLQKHGIEPDMASRMEKMASESDKEKAKSKMEMLKAFGTAPPPPNIG
jgi:hypothetical protein